ncbi:hypothetical protein PG984_014332 [Apiospora sp. TS-2023a]
MSIPPEELGLSQLHLACLNGDSRKVNATLQTHPESIEQTTPDGTTPLMLAALMGHLEVFRFLLWDRSADIHKETIKGMKAADHARETEFAKLARAEYIEAGLAEENPFGRQQQKGDIESALESFAAYHSEETPSAGRRRCTCRNAAGPKWQQNRRLCSD